MELYTTQLVIWRRLGKYYFLDEESRPSLFDLLQWCTSQPGLANMHATDPRDRILPPRHSSRDARHKAELRHELRGGVCPCVKSTVRFRSLCHMVSWTASQKYAGTTILGRRLVRGIWTYFITIVTNVERPRRFGSVPRFRVLEVWAPDRRNR